MKFFENNERKFVEHLSNGSIYVDLKNCIINFKPGKTYVHKIKISNTTSKIQLIRIHSLHESKTFKFPNEKSVSIIPYGSWDLPVTFTSRSNKVLKHHLCLKNPTGQGNLTLELRAIPETNISLPRTINFGCVDIGLSVTRKLSLAPEPNPYRFRVFIPNRSDGLTVNPTHGEVFGNHPTDVTIVYTPQSYITLCIDLVFYLSKATNQHKPQVVTLTAETKPKTNTFIPVPMDKKMQSKINLPPLQIRKKKDKSNTTIFNRLNLNKMLMEKHTHFDNAYTWLNPLGEYDKVYRESYKRDCEDFIAEVKRWGVEHKRTGFSKIPRLELNPTTEYFKYIIDKRKTLWNTYKGKLYSHEKITCNDEENRLEPLGLRERSIRMNCVHKSEYDFNPITDDNWWTRFRTYAKFVNAVKIVIVKNRLEKRLKTFKLLIVNNIINTL